MIGNMPRSKVFPSEGLDSFFSFRSTPPSSESSEPSSGSLASARLDLVLSILNFLAWYSGLAFPPGADFRLLPTSAVFVAIVVVLSASRSLDGESQLRDPATFFSEPADKDEFLPLWLLIRAAPLFYSSARARHVHPLIVLLFKTIPMSIIGLPKTFGFFP